MQPAHKGLCYPTSVYPGTAEPITSTACRQTSVHCLLPAPPTGLRSMNPPSCSAKRGYCITTFRTVFQAVLFPRYACARQDTQPAHSTATALLLRRRLTRRRTPSAALQPYCAASNTARSFSTLQLWLTPLPDNASCQVEPGLLLIFSIKENKKNSRGILKKYFFRREITKNPPFLAGDFGLIKAFYSLVISATVCVK